MEIKNITLIQKKGSIKNDKTLDRKKNILFVMIIFAQIK